MSELHQLILKSPQDAWRASPALPSMPRRYKEPMAKTSAARFRQARVATDSVEGDRWIGLEINVEKLYQLLACGAMSVTDFRCRDHNAKCCVRALCLQACSYGLNGPTVVDGSGSRRCQDHPT